MTDVLASEDRSRVAEAGDHANTMVTLKRQLTGIRLAIPTDKPVVYLDYPMHPNVGDLLIHLGTEQFLDEGGYKVAGRYSIYDFCVSDRPGRPRLDWKPNVALLDQIVGDDATIVMHGGGNLGDIYWNHQMFRDLVVRRFPRARIVLLPQSAHFRSEERRAEVSRIMGAHGRITAFARDAETLTYLRDECRIAAEAMPDMAHALWGTGLLPCPLAAANTPPLYLWRQDDEQGEVASKEPAGPGRHKDWEEMVSQFDWWVVKAIAKLQTIAGPGGLLQRGHQLWYPYRDILVRRALELYQGSETIYTDRLHGMILGALTNREVRFRDNSYGKLSRYHRLWLRGSDRIQELS